MLGILFAAGDPTLSGDGIRNWWDTLPDGWKFALLALALILLIIGMVKRLFVLTLVSAVVAGALIAWWWWAGR